MLKLVRPVGLILLSGALCSTLNINAAGKNPASSTSISQQKTKLTGNVIDVFGPVTGASVLIKGTTNGTITDLDGNFTLDVAKGETLVISFIGYVTQEIVVKDQSTLAINLAEDSQALDELVVTALGMKRSEKALGYSVTELKGDDLNTNAINPISSLQGKVAGVEISGSDGGMFGASKIQIRGASTLSGNNQPIYVVDGVILNNDISAAKDSDYESSASDYGNELKNLNPDDFQSISVLKGAAATALYGSRGLNGAVVITTKGGGSFSGFGVSVSQTFGIDHVYATADRQMVYGQGTLAGDISYGEQNSDGSFKKWDTNQFFLRNGNPSVIGADAMHWGPRYDGRAIENYDGSMTSYSPIKNNYKDAYQLGLNSNTNVSVRGGNEKTNYYTSLSYKKAKGVVEFNDFERYSMLLKGSHKISDRVDISASVNFANSNPRNAQRNIGEGFNNGTYATMYDTKYFRNKYTGDKHGGLANANYGDKYANIPGKENWFQLDNYDYTRSETVIRPTVEVNVKILDWLRFRAEGNMNYYFENYESKQLGDGYANDGGFYSMGQNNRKQSTFAGTFTFDKAVKDFNFGGFLRSEYYNTSATTQFSETSGGLIVPGQYFLENSKNPLKTEAYVHGTKQMVAVVAAANISWRDQVFLDITARNDWSSSLVYTNGTGNYSYFYPSVGGSWLINESFDLPKWITLAKVRGSWAQVGNDTDPYSIYSGYSVGSILQGDGNNIYINGIPSKLFDTNLKPERKNAWEVGVDWRVLNGRIGFDATYYKENTKDQIMNIAIPSVSGISQQLINAGNIQNSGVEIALNAIPFQNKDWEWTVDLTYTKNNNKIISLHPNVANYIALQGDVAYGNYRVGSVAMVGGDYGMLMSDAVPKRNENGEIILTWRDDYRAAYAARSGEAEEIGSLTPDFLGSFSTGLKWKDLTLRVGLDMRMGGLVASYSNRYGTAYGITSESMKYRDAENGGMSWTSGYADSNDMEFNDGMIPQGVFADGTVVTGVDGTKHSVGGQSYQSLVDKGILEPQHASSHHFWNNQWSTGTVNDSWVSELNYIALREVTLHYNLPKTFTSKLGAKRMGLAFSARNLGYLYNSLPNNLNPESIRGNNAAEFRERSNSPYTASYMLTVNLDF